MRACILIRAKPGSSDDIVRYARKLEGVTHAFGTFGRFDVAARAEVRHAAALGELLGQVNAIDGVLSTETLPELEVGA
jgi:uncharacterized protein with GYD domain